MVERQDGHMELSKIIFPCSKSFNFKYYFNDIAPEKYKFRITSSRFPNNYEYIYSLKQYKYIVRKSGYVGDKQYQIIYGTNEEPIIQLNCKTRGDIPEYFDEEKGRFEWYIWPKTEKYARMRNASPETMKKLDKHYTDPKRPITDQDRRIAKNQ